MKLRNKHTGKEHLAYTRTVEWSLRDQFSIKLRVFNEKGATSYYYSSLDKMNRDWEDA